jgi:hypothetical protein
MPTDYKKLLEVCPVLEKKEDEIVQKMPTLPQGKVDTFVNFLGDDVSSKALQAQPELLEEKRKAQEAERRAIANGDDKAFSNAMDAGMAVDKKAVDNVRAVCKPPPAPLTS